MVSGYVMHEPKHPCAYGPITYTCTNILELTVVAQSLNVDVSCTVGKCTDKNVHIWHILDQQFDTFSQCIRFPTTKWAKNE